MLHVIDKQNENPITHQNMKKRKRIVLLTLLSVFYITSFAQMEVSKPDRLKPKIGIRAGFNLSNFVEQEDDGINSSSYDLLPGFHAGIFVEIPIGERFAFEPGIMISRKGFQYSSEWTDSIGQLHEYYQVHTLYYLDIPLPFIVSQEFGIMKIFGGAGPYLGFGIGGNMYDEEKIDGVKDENDYKIAWGNKDPDDYRNLDWGLTFNAGVEIKSFQVSFAYELGFANISEETGNGLTINNKVARFSVAYKFGKIE